MRFFKYRKDSSSSGYNEYRETQIAANKRKLDKQWIDEISIRWLSERILEETGQPSFGLCHGTRRGNEQAWFSKYLGCDVLGTEISDTATQFPNTIEWDFHEVKPEWVDACDFVYSNSWDHGYRPKTMFRAWMSCVRPSGLLVLTHTSDHVEVKPSDPLGMELEELRALIAKLGDGKWRTFIPEDPPQVVTTFKNAKGLACCHLFAQRPG